MSSTYDSDSGINVGYYPSIYSVVRDNLPNALSWSSKNVLYLTETFMERLPGFAEVDLRNQCACGSVELTVTEAIPDAMEKPLQVIFAELDAMAIGAVRAANKWLADVYEHLPALKKRLLDCETRNFYEYDYVIYSSLVHQEASKVLEDTGLLDILGYCEKTALAPAMLLEYWEESTKRKADHYESLWVE